MKSKTIVAILASVASTHPHGRYRHHHKARELITVWETIWETATLTIDANPTENNPQSSPTTTRQTNSSQVGANNPIDLTTDTHHVVSGVTMGSTNSPSTTTTSDGIPYGEIFSGEITYYNAGLGACGYPDDGKDDTTNIVAIPAQFWDNISTATSYGLNQPAHPLCDKTITITSLDGKATTATIRDRCGGCAGHAIDVTPHAFNELFGSLEGGRLDCTWEINL
ncbi:uncharacterized protein F4822DRAFT_435501 [Hypoxylon trugodes]|uniref:uncharacterized protein n=1 Tax=Hypoxylon trugodes TaxID=326681 RepID=UPI00219F3EFB|nr:uncharacterized protein F4822DRAFT_435501 [Hypoxylon trugodes]KAI1382513.1 hypothetical protein F4822DRAFT_435501 [Hypoxylon trugodes]